LERFAAAWAGDAVVRAPAVNAALSSKRVLTMARARGLALAALPHDDPALAAAVGTAIVRVAWGTPLRHGFFNADPNPGNYLVERDAEGHVHVWFLDFGCTVELTPDAAAADRQLWHGVLDEDAFSGAEKFRMSLAQSGLLRRTDTLASTAHRAWEHAVAAPFASTEPFRWDRTYHAELSETTRGVLAAGGMQMPPSLLLLWRARLGTSAVLSMLAPRAPFRRVLRDLIGTGRTALR
ncbi:MAG: hypothetical protein K8M05_01145, partial [Deltaproteobacteria bacterium]|nr:hypothetical protein [Kofleriaceae bacterium]